MIWYDIHTGPICHSTVLYPLRTIMVPQRDHGVRRKIPIKQCIIVNVPNVSLAASVYTKILTAYIYNGTGKKNFYLLPQNSMKRSTTSVSCTSISFLRYHHSTAGSKSSYLIENYTFSGWGKKYLIQTEWPTSRFCTSYRTKVKLIFRYRTVRCDWKKWNLSLSD